MAHIFLSRPSAVLKVQGCDAATFLQGQFTNELRQAPGNIVYGLFLNQKGRVVADAQVLRLAEAEFLVTSNHTRADIIRLRLEEYIIADDVTLTDETAEIHGLAIWGTDSGVPLRQLLGDLPSGGRFVRSGEVLFFAGRRSRGENYEVLGPEQAIAALSERLIALGCCESGIAQAEFSRIAAGMPVVPADIGPGDLPNEGGFEEIAISYTKGCYLGQEVMARLKNLGQIRRRLHVVRGAGSAPEVRAAVYQAGKSIGEIRSVAQDGQEFVAFAMLSLLNLNPDDGLSLAPDLPPTLTIVEHG